MIYLVVFNWGWIAGAAAIGWATGWVSPISRVRSLSPAVLRWSFAGLVASIALSLARLLPGRFGYWFDLGLVMIVAYLAGCCVGSWLRYIALIRPMSPRAEKT